MNDVGNIWGAPEESVRKFDEVRSFFDGRAVLSYAFAYEDESGLFCYFQVETLGDAYRLLDALERSLERYVQSYFQAQMDAGDN